MTFRASRRRAISEVIATVMLSAAVITIGSITWAYSRSATVIMTNDYMEETVGELQYFIERCTIERVTYNNSTHKLSVYVYNYGTNLINATLYYEASYFNEGTGQIVVIPLARSPYKSLAPQALTCYELTYSFPSGTNMLIKCISERGNRVDKYYSVL